MPRVICALPNASDEISGVKFTALEDGRKISEEVSDEVAGSFASITGYELDLDDEGDSAPPAPVAPPAPTLTKAQQKAAAKKAAAEAAAVAAPAPEPGVVDKDTDVVDGSDDTAEDDKVKDDTQPPAEVF